MDLDPSARRSLRRKAAIEGRTRLTPGLGRLPVVNQVVVLVHSPDAHFAGGFEPERLVHLLHHVEVDCKRLARKRRLILGREGADEAEDQEEREEREFVAGAVVEASRRAERGPEVEREFGNRNVLRRRERLVVQPVGLLYVFDPRFSLISSVRSMFCRKNQSKLGISDAPGRVC